MSYYTIPNYLDGRKNNTPGVCLDRCRDRNYTYAGVKLNGYGVPECYCGHAFPDYARVHPSECSEKCPGTNETCGARRYGTKFFTVVGPGYPSIPAYCAHASSVPHFQYDNLSLGPKHCVKMCALGHPKGRWAPGGYEYATRGRAECKCGSLAPPSFLEVDKSKCDNPCRWDGPEAIRRQMIGTEWRTVDILADSSEYVDPWVIGSSQEYFAADSEEQHEADMAEWVCGGKEYLSYQSVYKLTYTAPLDNSEEDSGMEVSSMEDSSVEG